MYKHGLRVENFGISKGTGRAQPGSALYTHLVRSLLAEKPVGQKMSVIFFALVLLSRSINLNGLFCRESPPSSERTRLFCFCGRYFSSAAAALSA